MTARNEEQKLGPAFASGSKNLAGEGRNGKEGLGSGEAHISVVVIRFHSEETMPRGGAQNHRTGRGTRGESEGRREGRPELAEFQGTLLYWLSQLEVRLKNLIVISRLGEALDGADDERPGVGEAASHKEKELRKIFVVCCLVFAFSSR